MKNIFAIQTPWFWLPKLPSAIDALAQQREPILNRIGSLLLKLQPFKSYELDNIGRHFEAGLGGCQSRGAVLG